MKWLCLILLCESWSQSCFIKGRNSEIAYVQQEDNGLAVLAQHLDVRDRFLSPFSGETTVEDKGERKQKSEPSDLVQGRHV